MDDDRLWTALAEPNRRRLLALLVTEELTVNEIAGRLELTQPTTSKHLKVLREAGLVTVRVEAQQRWYGVRDEGLRQLDGWLEPYRRRWTTSLDRLGAHLARDALATGHLPPTEADGEEQPS